MLGYSKWWSTDSCQFANHWILIHGEFPGKNQYGKETVPVPGKIGEKIGPPTIVCSFRRQSAAVHKEIYPTLITISLKKPWLTDELLRNRKAFQKAVSKLELSTEQLFLHQLRYGSNFMLFVSGAGDNGTKKNKKIADKRNNIWIGTCKKELASRLPFIHRGHKESNFK